MEGAHRTAFEKRQKKKKNKGYVGNTSKINSQGSQEDQTSVVLRKGEGEERRERERGETNYFSFNKKTKKKSGKKKFRFSL